MFWIKKELLKFSESTVNVQGSIILITFGTFLFLLFAAIIGWLDY